MAICQRARLKDSLKEKEKTVVFTGVVSGWCMLVRGLEQEKRTVCPRNKSIAFPPRPCVVQKPFSVRVVETGSILWWRLNGDHGLGIKHTQI